jgi:outer membrane protein assembly factor BamB
MMQRGDVVPASVTEYANPAKSSRVDVTPCAFASIAPFADVPNLARFIYTDPSGAFVLVHLGEGIGGRGTRVFDRSGAPVKFVGDGGPMTWESVLALPDGFIVGIDRYAYRGSEASVTVAGGVGPSGRGVATRYIDGRYTTTAQVQVAQAGESRYAENEIGVDSEVPPRDRGYPASWGATLPGLGSAAIAPDGRVVVAMRDGRIQVFAADGVQPEGSNARILVDTHVAGEPYKLSVVDGGFAILALPAPFPGDPETEDDVLYRLHATEVTHKLPVRWSTEVRMYDDAGREQWRATVPFEGLQPPIAGNGGRLYVAGNGLAAVEDGKVVWSMKSETLTRATAFADGTLAVAVGPALRIVDSGGHIKQEFRTADGEDITTPPAIAGDGAVYVGTAKRVYVLK